MILNNHSDDDAEFQELTRGDPDEDVEYEPRAKKKGIQTGGFQGEEVEKDVPPAPGQVVQYARVGSGFLPTTSTVSTLTPGIYHIEEIQAGLLFVPNNVVSDRLLRLPDSKSDFVITEIEKFWPLKPKFDKLGFAHKRGILLWGPPGSGKTATIAIIMRQMVENQGIVILGHSIHPVHLSHALAALRQIEPERRLVVILEDIDTVIDDYGESEVLSLLDGESSIDNVVFVATTNYPENLDGRVINRPSRFDRIVKIGLPTLEARKMYLQSRDLGDEVDVDAWAAASDGLSIAHLKELIVSVCCYGHPFKTEIERLKRMFTPVKSGEKTIGFSDDRDNDE